MAAIALDMLSPRMRESTRSGSMSMSGRLFEGYEVEGVGQWHDLGDMPLSARLFEAAEVVVALGRASQWCNLAAMMYGGFWMEF